MNRSDPQVNASRRGFLGKGSALVFACSTGGMQLLALNPVQAQTLAAAPRPIGPEQLDTWLAFDTDGMVTVFFGKMDMGQGVDTAIAQIVAEELDIDVSRVSVVMGDTHRTPDQGGASGSSACRQGAIPLRNAAAEARRVLVTRAADVLGVPVEQCQVEDGTVSVTGANDRSVSYTTLIADGFDTNLDWNGNYGNGLNVSGQATPKSVDQYQVVGTGVARKDIAGKILATTEFCHHVSLPDMLHGRCIRPPVANAVPVSVDESSIAPWPDARVIREGDLSPWWRIPNGMPLRHPRHLS